MAAGDPTGDDLASGTTDGSTLIAAFGEREITLDTPIELTSGVMYAIVVHNDGAALGWNYQVGNPYANGAKNNSIDSGIIWSGPHASDFWFKTKASGVEKDTYTFADTTWSYTSFGANWSAQSFTASSTYTISSIVLMLKKVSGSLGTVEVSIKATAAAPTKAKTPAPANTVTNVTLDQATITWEDGGGADTYNVYYGDNAAAVAAADTTDETGIYLGNQVGTSLTVTGITLGSPYAYLITRYWRIDSVNDAGTTTGDAWSFTTIRFDPPGVTYYDRATGQYYRLLIGSDDTYGDHPIDGGVEDTDFVFLAAGYVPNFISTTRKLVGVANSKVWLEDL